MVNAQYTILDLQPTLHPDSRVIASFLKNGMRVNRLDLEICRNIASLLHVLMDLKGCLLYIPCEFFQWTLLKIFVTILMSFWCYLMIVLCFIVYFYAPNVVYILF